MKFVSTTLFAAAVACALALQFSAGAAAQTQETVLHSFSYGADGGDPAADLIDVNGTLYGTTFGGGTYGEGTVFSVDPVTSAEAVLHMFGQGLDGQAPAGSVIDVNGTLYGTTFIGGAYCQGSGSDGCGVAFALDLKTGAETVLHAFCSQENCPDGAYPNAGLIDVQGMLIGTTTRGGANSGGTVFALDPNTGAETVLYSFCGQQNCTDGEYPYSSLIDVKGKLYGTSFYGGTTGDGTVFAFDPGTGAEKVLYSFCSRKRCEDGAAPYASLVAGEGKLYGTAYLGGRRNRGTVFALDPDTGRENVLHSFCSQPHCTDGQAPYADLIEVKGVLYGTAQEYGVHGFGGLVYAIDPKTRVETSVYSFCRILNCTDGDDPTGGVIDVGGTLYGTTATGGTYGSGTVFELKMP